MLQADFAARATRSQEAGGGRAILGRGSNRMGPRTGLDGRGQGWALKRERGPVKLLFVSEV